MEILNHCSKKSTGYRLHHQSLNQKLAFSGKWKLKKIQKRGEKGGGMCNIWIKQYGTHVGSIQKSVDRESPHQLWG